MVADPANHGGGVVIHPPAFETLTGEDIHFPDPCLKPQVAGFWRSLGQMSFRSPWRSGNLDLVDCFAPGSQAF